MYGMGAYDLVPRGHGGYLQNRVVGVKKIDVDAMESHLDVNGDGAIC